MLPSQWKEKNNLDDKASICTVSFATPASPQISLGNGRATVWNASRIAFAESAIFKGPFFTRPNT